MKYSVVVIGGGIIGSSAAYFLASAGRSVAVVETDSSYQFATTPQGAGGVRQQFSLPENISQSIYSLDFYKHWATHFAEIEDLPDLNFQEQGYLFVVSEVGVEDLQRNASLQNSMGVNAQVLTRNELLQKFPSISRDDIALAVYTPDDGWVDPNAALWGFRRAAQHHGATYISDKVTGIGYSTSEVTDVFTSDGTRIEADTIINCAGPWVNEIAKMTKAALPVVPMCRVQHYWKCAHKLEALPLVKDESGLFFRPEGDGFAGGRPSFEIEPGFVDDIYSGYFSNYFEESVWPILASLVPDFEDIKLQKSWAGHYAQNLLDGNLIIGQYSPGHSNLLTASGFSGHGIMHAPAVGRALCELVIYGKYQTIDLSRFGIERVFKNLPLAESGIK